MFRATIQETVLRVAAAQESKLPSADVRYSVTLVAQDPKGRSQKQHTSFVISLQADNRVSSLRTADGHPASVSDLYRAAPLAHIYASQIYHPDYRFDLVLPAKPVGPGDTWAAWVSRPGFEAPPMAMEPARWRLIYALIGFVKWNGRECANIRATYKDPPQKNLRTYYFDWRRGVLVGLTTTGEQGQPGDVLWLANQ